MTKITCLIATLNVGQMLARKKTRRRRKSRLNTCTKTIQKKLGLKEIKEKISWFPTFYRSWRWDAAGTAATFIHTPSSTRYDGRWGWRGWTRPGSHCRRRIWIWVGGLHFGGGPHVQHGSGTTGGCWIDIFWDYFPFHQIVLVILGVGCRPTTNLMGQSVARNGHPIHWVTIHKNVLK